MFGKSLTAKRSSPGEWHKTAWSTPIVLGTTCMDDAEIEKWGKYFPACFSRDPLLIAQR
jgi:hypothetical protein